MSLDPWMNMIDEPSVPDKFIFGDRSKPEIDVKTPNCIVFCQFSNGLLNRTGSPQRTYISIACALEIFVCRFVLSVSQLDLSQPTERLCMLWVQCQDVVQLIDGLVLH